ncbi:hypothetical protein AB1J99_30935 [Bacillus bombysepticus]|nr:hypothetical protein COI92_06925 [Bacillus anthracis]
MNNNKTKVSSVEDKLKATNKIVGLRLNVNQENKKYAYVFVKTRFAAGQFTIHIQDRRHLDSGVSILDCILDVQDELINLLGVREFVYKFLNESKWILYGKNGDIREFKYGEQEVIDQVYTAGLDDQFLELSLERKGVLKEKLEVDLRDNRYYNLFVAI